MLSSCAVGSVGPHNTICKSLAPTYFTLDGYTRERERERERERVRQTDRQTDRERKVIKVGISRYSK